MWFRLCDVCRILIVTGQRPHRHCWHCRLFRSVFSLAEQVGVTLADREPNPWQWDGKTVAAKWYGILRSPQDLVHEVAHFQIASKRRVGMPDFGLGADDVSVLYGKTRATKPVVSESYALNEDNRATTLLLAHARAIDAYFFGSLLQKLPFGLHTWQDVAASKEMRRDVQWLEKRGLIVDGRGTAKTARD